MALSTASINAFGYIGSAVLALAAPTQFVTCLTRGSTKDISYLWLGIFLAGLAFLFAYASLLGLVPIWAPLIVEIVGTSATLLLKVWYDCGDRRVYVRHVGTQCGKPEAAA
ncbi:hypothetical protein TrRE_jg9456, partial [Triparma retinervis]